jgi:predicted unusual protein kinase regulating ubiquinone biosynthesis (AarF/ABC1/UbiB family)
MNAPAPRASSLAANGSTRPDTPAALRLLPAAYCEELLTLLDTVRPFPYSDVAGGYDLVQIVRHLDWNILNQVFVFGGFHSDRHSANLFVLPRECHRLCRLRHGRPLI